MEHYDFDHVIERRGSGALKTDALLERYGDADLQALWVADMDFATPPFIIDAIKRRLDHPVLGYTVVPPKLWTSIIEWVEKLHGWKLQREWLTYIPGIVKGIGMAINVFVRPDEKVIIQPPVYHPFRLTPLGNRREVVMNPLIHNADGSYSMDFDNLRKVADSKCRMLILSNPHNPAGIVWSKETLVQLADICRERDIIVISDEIHSDMTLFGHRHTPFSSVSDAAAQCSITFGAPSKTFNIAGVVSSYAVVINPQLRERFYSWLNANELDDPTIFAPIATIAAFSEEGDRWRRQMLRYVEDNIDFVIDFCKSEIPQIKPFRPQASFLVWLDCRQLGLTHEQLLDLFIRKAGLALNDGAMFGIGGEGFMRLNVGCPRSLLEKALRSLKAALNR